MKKLLCAILICALCAGALCACHRRAAPEADDAPARAAVDPGVTPVPEEGGHGEEDQSQALEQLPTLAPAETVEGAQLPEDGHDDGMAEDYFSVDALIEQAGQDAPEAQFDTYDESARPPVGGDVQAIDPNAYSFSVLEDENMRFTFNYPTAWQNIPGVYTICYREVVEPGDFPARVSVTAKQLVHSPEGTVLTDELTAFVRAIYKQYEASTFQLGTANGNDTFLGKPAYSNTYLAYSGETEVKGFIIGTSLGRTMYVFHFCASYEDYAAMEKVMRYMVNSARIMPAEN